MATPRDIPGERPASHHGISSAASSMPGRPSSSRHHAHSVSLGAFNPDHRVTRRKSVNNNAAASAGGLRTTANGADDSGGRSSNRRSMPSKTASASRGLGGSSDGKIGQILLNGDESAIADDLAAAPSGISAKARARRASEGSQLGGKRVSREVKCEKCGKGYKHSSCLTKHLWEHTPEWALTSKLLISKHQQVQLLEAATVLVGMNADTTPEVEITKSVESDNSASPAASGSSGLPEDDEYSSAETTPPPMSEHYGLPMNIGGTKSKRYSANSSSFSRSYQSAPSTSLSSNHGLVSPGGFASNDEEEASLAAAVQSLCSFGTPRNGPVLLPADVPPVPPLPAQFLDKGLHFPPLASSAKGHSLGAVSVREVAAQDVEMEDEQAEVESERPSSAIQAEPEDYEDGFFGGMEGLTHDPLHGQGQGNLSYTRST